MISNDVFTATSFTTSALGNTLSVTGYDAATGVVSYSYTLLDNETHAPGAGTNSLPENLAVVLTDQDNQTANDTLVATIVDDVPSAVADGPITPAEDTAITFSVTGNDVFGADGVDLVSGVAKTTDPTKGTVSYNGDGTFTYTPTAGQTGSDSFTYTITDRDGDSSTATVIDHACGGFCAERGVDDEPDG